MKEIQNFMDSSCWWSAALGISKCNIKGDFSSGEFYSVADEELSAS